MIGSGTADMAKNFIEQFALDIQVYTDPSRDVFKQAGMKHKLGLGFGTISKGFRASRAGFRQGKVQGDPKQQGGVLVIGKEGELLYAHIDNVAGEVLDFASVLEALGVAPEAAERSG